ncbi:PhnD/SsuA/transferrin family substrate-binding protein [Mesobacillus selenatarsenatis]|uniref:Periplasmic binding protein-related protein n=1 Tax=Mesobacillus selenatarsenatis (strain DSM 18680 / JCM 14380 / FERM P-15431 / SF-1) TaxID=1321606 RepID=A0A0A8X5N1_MESS1|nr:PhnD/SsuA/transferrin family substrate-binding protein [Mesobacillus selenatarsenatis]GAM13401.1 periplasmic binding protein-related protein [Mesobacillus selenatarsenatis SF-1]
MLTSKSFIKVLSVPLLIGSAVLISMNTYKEPEIKIEHFPKESEKQNINSDIQFGVYNELSPLMNFVLFNKMANDITEKTSLLTHLHLKKSYSEFNMLLEDGQIDVAYLYLDQYSFQNNMKEYSIVFSPSFLTPPRSLIVVKDDSIQEISNLSNQVFGFTEPSSVNSQGIEEYLEAIGESKETFFGNYYYSFYVDESISALQSNIVKGISIDSLNLSIINNFNNKRVAPLLGNLQVVREFESGPQPVILISNNLNIDIKEKIYDYFRNFPVDKKQEVIAETIQVSSFDEINNDRLK